MLRLRNDGIWTIYAIQHLLTGRIYVGRTRRYLQDRIDQHAEKLKGGKHSCKAMQEDCDKYGGEYVVYLLEETKDRTAEARHMDRLHTGNAEIGYNFNDPHYVNRKEPVVISKEKEDEVTNYEIACRFTI